MRRISYTAIMIAIAALGQLKATAKSQDTTLALSDIKLTNAPAFNLLDVSPSSIETTPSTKAISLSIANAINMGNGVPQNYALEVTPFWLMKHAHMTANKYFGLSPDGKKNNVLSSARFVSVSFGIINKDTTTNIGTLANHNIGLGVRTTLIKIYKKNQREKIKKFSGNVSMSQEDFLDRLGDASESITHAKIDSYEKFTAANFDSIKANMQAKPRFSLDVACATNMAFDNSSFDSRRVSRTGAWINAAYSFDIAPNNKNECYINIYGLGKYINSNDSLGADGKFITYNLYDFGGKAELEIGKLSVAYEYIQRIASSEKMANTYKSVGILQYKIKDGLFITGAFGQNFGDIKNVITTFGINWGFSSGVVTAK